MTDESSLTPPPTKPETTPPIAQATAAAPTIISPLNLQGVPLSLAGMPAGISQVAMQLQVWQGQFPPPEAVQQYEAILPGTFNRLLTMAEHAQENQASAMRDAQRFQRDDVRRGQYLGFALAIAAVGGAIEFVFMNQPWVAGLCLGVPVLAVAIVN